jgi:hypothetical protein
MKRQVTTIILDQSFMAARDTVFYVTLVNAKALHVDPRIPTANHNTLTGSLDHSHGRSLPSSPSLARGGQ